MKNALILHGLDGHSKENWFPWLEAELVKKGYTVWVPDLPIPERPNIARFNSFLRPKWKLDSESIIVGHSSGAMASLGFLQENPNDVVISKVYLVAGFMGDLGLDALHEIAEFDYDLDKIKNKANKFILFNSDNDPYVPLGKGDFLRKKLNAEFIVLKDHGHFSASLDPEFTLFPELLDKIVG